MSLPAGALQHAPTAAGPTPSPEELGQRLAQAARELGFARVGFCPVERFDDASRRLGDWLSAGYGGEMAYLAGGDRADPRALLREARSLVVVALAYPAPPIPLRRDALGGAVARYARGQDYHRLIKQKLRALADASASLAGRPVLARPCVDTAPLLEREAARRAGVGFTAKNTLTLVPGIGSYVLLGELLLDVDVAPSTPVSPGCGSCRACLDACPTQAFVDAHVLDARRCISYLTIELRGAIPRELRSAIGTRVFGCDACQEVCPHNVTAPEKAAAAELAGPEELDLPELLALTSSGYRRLVKGRALGRATRPMLARNAAVALGNTHDPRAVPALASALAEHSSALVRSHAAWALGEIGGERGKDALARALSDDDAGVREEARHALDRLNGLT